MSRTINESVQLLTETLGNCKTALTEKQVADVDNIKISDVDEKISEIKAGGSSKDVAEMEFSYFIYPYTGLLILFTNIDYESETNGIKVNNQTHEYKTISANETLTSRGKIYILPIKSSDPDTLEIEVTTSYDSSSRYNYLRNVAKPTHKVVVMNARFE